MTQKSPKIVMDHIVEFIKELPHIIYNIGEEIPEGYSPELAVAVTCQHRDGSHLRSTVTPDYFLKPVGVRISGEKGFIIRFTILDGDGDEEIKFADFDMSELSDVFPAIADEIEEMYVAFMTKELKPERWSTMNSIHLINALLQERVRDNNNLLKTMNTMLARGAEKEELEGREKTYNEIPNYGAF